MFDHRYDDRPPMYSPPYSATSQTFYPASSVQFPQRQYSQYSYGAPPDSFHVHERPQHFHRWFSPPGFIKTFQAATALMCFVIFACVASTLVWDVNGYAYMGYGAGAAGADPGYYGGTYGYGSSYMTPQSAKAAMISVTAINFLVSLGFLVGSFSRTRVTRGCRFYFSIFVCDIILAVLQVIIDIVFVIGVNPMSQSSQSALYNPMLMMCQNIQSNPSLSGSLGAGFPGGFPMYNRYLYHYCYMDPEEAVAFVLGILVVVALSLSAYYAYKTRSKIWRHGRANIYWDQPLAGPPEGRGAPAWENYVGEARGTTQASTVLLSERAAPEPRTEDGAVSCSNATVSVRSEGRYEGCSSSHHDDEPPQRCNRGAGSWSSSSDEADGFRKAPPHKTQKGKPPELRPQAQESQYETGYTTGDTGNELDQDHSKELFRLYPEIISDEQRRRYKAEFDSDLIHYKTLCAEMDELSDQIHQLSRKLDGLDEDSIKYQGVADEYNRLKDLKRMPDYQEKKKRCKGLRQKLFHIKRLVKIYDQGIC
ncbi:Occludin [Takifugu flavidus]|uniref:Occludin n=1 Tax=Takifugu flavidus TaxID=433684 RepID=A0A5C6P106_9TELE|nr:Occludin [Takifugu flavidus]